MASMITVAITKPKAMGKIDWRGFWRRKAATKAPVQAPVPGKGMPTKSIKPSQMLFGYFSVKA